MQYSQKGFTLVELMISLTLGLIIVAAGILLFSSAQRNLALQQAGSEIQDNANFALNYITKDIRIANLNNASATITAGLADGGIVFNAANVSGINSQFVTASQIGASNVNIASDQLTIQYLPVESGFDCEGTAITDLKQYVVERYFLRSDTNLLNGENNNNALSLACDAGRKVAGGAVTGLGGNGQIIIKRADYFTALLVVQSDNGTMRTMTIADYLKTSATSRILAVQLGILARSTQPINVPVNVSQFNLLNQNLTVNNELKVQYLREPIIQTVALRNGFGSR